jgi:hypothetical protein
MPHHIFLCDNDRVFKYFCARSMIVVMVAVNHVFHRNVKSSGQLGFDPVSRFLVDGVGQNNTFRCIQKCRERIHFILDIVQVAGNMFDFASRLVTLGKHRSRD